VALSLLDKFHGEMAFRTLLMPARLMTASLIPSIVLLMNGPSSQQQLALAELWYKYKV
jgi:hypothetical protein